MTERPAAPGSALATLLEECGLLPAQALAVLERGPFPDDAALCAAVDAVVLRMGNGELVTALEAVPPPEVQYGDPDALAAALLALQLYRDRFGYAFVSGIDTPASEELLMRVRIRLGNDPEPEGRAAREHFRRVVRRRLQVALDNGSGS